MLKTLGNKISMLLYFLIATLLLEVLTFGMLDMGIFPEYFLYDMAMILFVAMLIYLIPNYTAQYVIYTIILILQVVLLYINYTLFMVYGDLLSIDMLIMVKEAGAAITSDFINVAVLIQLLALMFAIGIIGYFILKFCKREKIKARQHYSIVMILIFVCVQIFSCVYIIDERTIINDYGEGIFAYTTSDAFLMNTSFYKARSYSKFGTYGYIFNMFASEDTEEIKNAAVLYMNDGTMYESSDVFGIDEGNNVIVIMMESLEWFMFGDGNYDSELNNLSYELTPNIYSLIYGEDYLEDSKNTNVYNDGLVATNFFAKSKTNYSEAYGILGFYPVGYSLNDIAGKKYIENSGALDFTMPSVLQDLGYTTSYVHSNEISFYDRDKTHSNLGFDVVVGKDTIKDSAGNSIYSGDELWWEHWDAEGDFARNAIDYIIPTDYNEDTGENENTDPFYTFYLTVSSHGEYAYNENEGDCVKYKYYVMYGEDDCIQDKNGDWVLDPDKSEEDLTYTEWYSNVLKNYADPESDLYDPDLSDELLYYMCGVMGTDEAIGVIIDELKTRGLYDNTTLLLYSDHYSYYSSLSNRMKGIDNDSDRYIELNKIPMIISSPGLRNLNESNKSNQDALLYTWNDRFCSAYDIIPTLFDLLGISFNENMYIGHSLFRENDPDLIYEVDGGYRDMIVYYSNTGGVYSENIYSINIRDYKFEGIEESDELIEMFDRETTNIVTKICYINLISVYCLYDEVQLR